MYQLVLHETFALTKCLYVVMCAHLVHNDCIPCYESQGLFFNDSRIKLEPAYVSCLQLNEVYGALHQVAIRSAKKSRKK